MKNPYIRIVLIACLLATVSCKKDFYSNEEDTAVQPPVETERTAVETVANPDPAHNSQNSINYTGVYQGVIPCADCEGIKTTITLSEDGSYTRSVQYLGKENTATTDHGIFTWNDQGSKITLSSDSGENQSYQVGENVLFHLDRAGNRITGDLAANYRLNKETLEVQEIENKKWVLVELIGKPIESQRDQRPFLLFNSEQTRITGNNGCNLINGNYELKGNGQIHIGELSLTKKACADMSMAASFNQVVNKVDNYSIVDGVLSLNRSKMATLAKFERE